MCSGFYGGGVIVLHQAFRNVSFFCKVFLILVLHGGNMTFLFRVSQIVC